MSRKVLITLFENDVAPRFDLATEVMITSLGEDGSITQSKTIVLAHPSAEDLCQLILTEEVDAVICGGIEEEFYDYLTWKKISVIDSVMGPYEDALDRFLEKDLQAGSILFDIPVRKFNGE